MSEEEINWKEVCDTDKPSQEEQLDVISALTEEMLNLEEEIAEKEKEIDILRKKHQIINQGTLPEAMLALGLTGLTHKSGKKLVVEHFYQAKISPEMEKQAFEYLEETGNDSIIKTDVGLKFDRGDRVAAKEIAATLINQFNLSPSMKTYVHPMTLKSFVREQIESGVSGFPLDVFGVYVGNRIKVK